MKMFYIDLFLYTAISLWGCFILWKLWQLKKKQRAWEVAFRMEYGKLPAPRNRFKGPSK